MDQPPAVDGERMSDRSSNLDGNRCGESVWGSWRGRRCHIERHRLFCARRGGPEDVCRAQS